MNTDLTPHPPSHDTENGHMGFLEHLVELRTRVIHSLVAILVIFLGMVFFANDIYSIFAKPLTSLLPPDTSMIATDIAAPFLAPFKLVFILSFFVEFQIISFSTLVAKRFQQICRYSISSQEPEVI